MESIKDRLKTGHRVRIKVKRESQEKGYRPCPDNTIGIFREHKESNGREFASIELPSGATINIMYDHLVEIVATDYYSLRKHLLEILDAG
jgi:hypothetical protein